MWKLSGPNPGETSLSTVPRRPEAGPCVSGGLGRTPRAIMRHPPLLSAQKVPGDVERNEVERWHRE
jgi:hypothetical protein